LSFFGFFDILLLRCSPFGMAVPLVDMNVRSYAERREAS
jgi:hypothetical protein